MGKDTGKGTKERKQLSTKDREFLDKVMKKLKRAVKAEEHNRTEALDDLRFLNGEQWDEEEKARRKRRKRVRLTINMLPEKVDKIIGDMRQNRARVKIRTASEDASTDIARIREGIIQQIEYNSDASSIYDYAGGRAAECGQGMWRVLTRYCEDNPFVQEIYLKVVKNSFMVYFDPEAKDPQKADAKWAFVLEKMTKEDFEDTYPKATLPGDNLQLGTGMGMEYWWDGENVTIAEFFVIETEEKMMCLMQDGKVLEKEEADRQVKEWNDKYGILENGGGLLPPAQTGVVPSPSTTDPLQGGAPSPSPMPTMTQTPVPMMMAPPPPPKPVIRKERGVESRKVKHWKLTACEVLEGPKAFPGKYIPLIEVLGKERNVEGKDYVRGAIRDAKDPQRLVNYWNTSAAEVVALAPRAPFIGTAKQFEGYEEDYANANIENYPFLKYNHDANAPGPPNRMFMGDPPVALFTQIQMSERNLDRVVGMGPDLRDVAPDASAKSIIQRQKPAELNTFPFIDNLAKAQLHCYKVINEMIPEVYDTERVVVMRQVDETETSVPINMPLSMAVKAVAANPDRFVGMDASKMRSLILKNGGDTRFNDIGVGRYEVRVDLGPTFSTQRQESAEKFVMLAQTNPRLWGIAGDLIVESLDIMKSAEMADRIKKTLPPGLVKKKPGEPQDPPMPPSPQSMLVMTKVKTEEAKQKKEMIKQQVELIRLKTELVRQYKEAKETDGAIRGEILKILEELHSPSHPADTAMMGGMGMGGGEINRGEGEIG